MTRDRATGVISVVLGAMVAVYAHFLPQSRMEGDIGPAVFPYIAAALLIVCGILLIARKAEAAEPFLPQKIQKKRFLLMTLVYILYGILLWAVGFLIATPLICFALCVMMSGSKRIPRWKLVAFSVLVTGIVYYCFYTLLSLKIPVGKLIRFVI